MSTTTLNGKPQRKQLSDQLDRLDSIIDCLADALPDAVRDAVQEGTKAALQQVLLELFRNPDTLAMLRQGIPLPAPSPVVATPATPPTPSTARSFWSRCQSAIIEKTRRLRQKLSPTLAAVKAKIADVKASLTNVKQRAGATLKYFHLLRQFKRTLAVSLSVGLLVLAVSCLSHSTATVLASIGTTMSCLAAQVAWWCRNAIRRIEG